MNKESKTLPKAIKTVVDVYGKSVVGDVRMVNIMGDVVSLEDSNAVKTILREVLKLGYGKKILNIDTSKEDIHLKVRAYSKEITDSHGYKEEIVQYILYSIAYGAGISPQVPRIRIIAPAKKESVPTNETITKQNKKTPIMVIVAVVLFLLICIGMYFSNNAIDDDFEKYRAKAVIGDSLFSNGDYSNAVESYKEAYNSDYSLNSSKYKKESLQKIDVIVEKLLKNGQTDNKSLYHAQQAIKSEMELNLSFEDRMRIETKSDEIQNLINEKTENGCNTLITILSANNGKLDENGKSLLLELLELSPDNHWLNIIKENSYE